MVCVLFTNIQQAGKDESQNPVKRGRTSARLIAMDANSTNEHTMNLVGGSESNAPSNELLGADKGESGRAVTSTPSRLLTVQTSFPDSALPPAGPHSGGSSTDTASEVASQIHSPSELSVSSNYDSLPDARILKSYFDEDLLGDSSKVDLDSRLAEAARVLNATSNELDSASKEDHAETGDSDGTKFEQRDHKNVPRQFTAKVSFISSSFKCLLIISLINSSKC